MFNGVIKKNVYLDNEANASITAAEVLPAMLAAVAKHLDRTPIGARIKRRVAAQEENKVFCFVDTWIKVYNMW